MNADVQREESGFGGALLVRWAMMLLLAAGAFQCGAPSVPHRSLSSDISPHTVERIDSLEQYLALAGEQSVSLRTVKFVITEFQQPDAAKASFMDGAFYTLHDEWYWFPLLNGYSMLGDAGFTDTPGCATPAECTQWVRTLPEPPAGLGFVKDRLYSTRFYELALARQRQVGIGAVLYREGSDTRSPVVGFRLEYMDTPTQPDVLRFFDVLQKSLPPQMAQSLVWVPRSPAQNSLARAMVSSGALAPSRVLPYAELATEGEAEIYNSGIAVGRLYLTDEAHGLISDNDDSRILVVDSPPDDLPQAAALISAVPLTALSHVNILARNRGIPSGYVGGIFNDPWIRQLADGYAPVVVEMTQGEIRVSPLTEAQYRHFKKVAPVLRFTGTADYETAPYVVALADVASLSSNDVNALIGGKCAGFDVLQKATPEAIPQDVMLITTRAYHEHVAPLEKQIDTLLSHPVFQNSARVRYYVLEGKDAYEQMFNLKSDGLTISELRLQSPLHYNIGQQGGVKALIRNQAVHPEMMVQILRALSRGFGDLPASQGLRFRSSSTIEDVDGFNGAGLYVSSTGFLHPEQLTDATQRSHTVEWAIRKTWASYWNFQAFEERRGAGLDHLSGAMGIVVHPRFDDEAELANGVVTFYWDISGRVETGQTVARMAVNTQKGALSVTNPPPDGKALPESIILTFEEGSGRRLERLRGAGEEGHESEVLDDAQYHELFNLCQRIASIWNTEKNVGRSGYLPSQSIVLDLEFRIMAPQWGGFAKERPDAPQLLIKQVRALEPAPLIGNILEMNLPFPKDVLLGANRVEKKVCAGRNMQLTFLEATRGNTVDASDASNDDTGRFIADLAAVTTNRMELLAPTEYELAANGREIVFRGTAPERLGLNRIFLDELACDSSMVAVANTGDLQELARNGRTVGRVMNP